MMIVEGNNRIYWQTQLIAIQTGIYLEELKDTHNGRIQTKLHAGQNIQDWHHRNKDHPARDYGKYPYGRDYDRHTEMNSG